MEKKIVIKVNVHSDKCRSKVLKTAASFNGVISVALEGDDKDKLVVVGKGIDAVELTFCLMKKVKYASIESVEQVMPEQATPEEVPQEDEYNKEIKPCFECYYRQRSSQPYFQHFSQARPPHYEYMLPYYDPNPPDSCSIL